MTLEKQNDAMGAAIADYYRNGVAGRLRVFSPDFDEDEIPVETLFRDFDEMPLIERTALELSKGKILDVGAGAGCHALALQDMGKDVDAIDISGLSVLTMKDRGVENAMEMDFYSLAPVDDEYRYDTILFLMNGSGIIGLIENMTTFFNQLKYLLRSGGVVYMDSSDIRYIFEYEDGSFEVNLNDKYYGELEYQLQYKRIKSKPFTWLYVDFATLQYYANESGFDAELIAEGENYDYLAKITLKK